MTQPENQIFAFCHRMGKSRIAPSRLDCGVYVIFNVEEAGGKNAASRLALVRPAAWLHAHQNTWHHVPAIPRKGWPKTYAKTYAGVLGVDRTLASRYPGCCPVASKNKAHESSGTVRLPDSQ